MSAAGDLFFWLCTTVAIATAVATVSVKSPIRAAVALLFHIVSLAGLYLALHAHLLAALQLIVYAGAVVVLFVFVIMLLGPGAETAGTAKGVLARTVGALVMAIAGAALASVVVKSGRPYAIIEACSSADCHEYGSVEAFGHALFTDAMLPFEIVGVLLLVAIIGAIAVARGRNAAEMDALKARTSAHDDPALNPGE